MRAGMEWVRRRLVFVAGRLCPNDETRVNCEFQTPTPALETSFFRLVTSLRGVILMLYYYFNNLLASHCPPESISLVSSDRSALLLASCGMPLPQVTRATSILGFPTLFPHATRVMPSSFPHGFLSPPLGLHFRELLLILFILIFSLLQTSFYLNKIS